MLERGFRDLRGLSGRADRATAPVDALIVDPRLRTFPSRDREFGAFVRSAWEGLEPPRTPGAIQHAIRARYPAAIVTVQNELARHGEDPVIWYAFRTATLGVPLIDDAESAGAWAILDDERRFLEVSRAFATIAELPVRHLLGHLVEDFSNPADPSIRQDIERLWREFLRRGRISSTLRFNYDDGRPRELAYRLEANADGPGRHRLSVKVLPEPPENG